MADTKISALTALAVADVDPAADFIPIVDTGVSTTKKILASGFVLTAGAQTVAGVKTFDSPVINTAVTGSAIASQAQQETGTAVNVIVTPGRQQFHASAAKGWCSASLVGGANVGYNVTSVTDNGPGDATVVWATDFSTNHCSIVTAQIDPGGTLETTYICTSRNTTTDVGNDRIAVVRASDGAYADPINFMVVVYGDQ